MNGYNLCDESWISARYKTGEVRKVGLRQFFTDVNDIETVNAPVFRGDAAVASLKWGLFGCVSCLGGGCPKLLA